MSNSIIVKRLITTIRTEICGIAKEIIRDGDLSKEDLPFNLDNPGDDQRFHDICTSIAHSIDHHMYEQICLALTGEY